MAGELVLATLRQILSLLAELKVDSAVMGGLAVAMWNHLRNTRDVDLLIGATPSTPRRLISDLVAAGLKPLKEPVVRSLGTSRVMQFRFNPSGRMDEQAWCDFCVRSGTARGD